MNEWVNTTVCGSGKTGLIDFQLNIKTHAVNNGNHLSLIRTAFSFGWQHPSTNHYCSHSMVCWIFCCTRLGKNRIIYECLFTINTNIHTQKQSPMNRFHFERKTIQPYNDFQSISIFRPYSICRCNLKLLFLSIVAYTNCYAKLVSEREKKHTKYLSMHRFSI